MADIMEHQRAFFHTAIDGSVHVGSNLTSRGANLLIGVEIDLVNHSSLASYILQLGHQGLRTIHKATFIIRKESDGIAPRLHGGLVFHNITFDLVDHLGSLFHRLHRETAHTDVGQRTVDIALKFIHKTEIVIRYIGIRHRQRSHRFVGRHKVNNAIAVLVIVGAITQKQQILDSSARCTVKIKHTAEVANGRNVFRAARELIVDLFRCGDINIQVRVDAVMDGFQTFGLFHKIGICQDDKVHIAHPMKVLVVNLTEGRGRMIRVAIAGHKLVIAVANHLETQGRATELTFHDGGLHGFAHIPHLGLLRGTRQSVLVRFIEYVCFGITEAHLVTRHFQAAPGIDEDIIHETLRGDGGTMGIVFQGDTHRLAIGMAVHPSTHIVSVWHLGRRGSSLNRIKCLLHIVDQHRETGRLEIASRQSRLHRAGK